MPPDPVPALVTLDVWGVPASRVPAALLRMGRDRAPLRRVPGLRFAKLLGTGSGRTFTVRDADPRHWALLACWDSGDAHTAFIRTHRFLAWQDLAEERWQAELVPLAARGHWSRREPFGRPVVRRGEQSGPIAAITRARLVPRRAVSFWRAVPPVSADLHRAAGLRFALGIGEAPLGLQGTFSVWDDAASLRSFAYDGPTHARAIDDTARLGWYAEELFARFSLRSAVGSYRGADPLARGCLG